MIDQQPWQSTMNDQLAECHSQSLHCGKKQEHQEQEPIVLMSLLLNLGHNVRGKSVDVGWATMPGFCGTNHAILRLSISDP